MMSLFNLLISPMIAVIGRAGALAGNHAGPHRIHGGAAGFIQGALRRGFDTHQDFTAGTAFGLPGLRQVEIEFFPGIEIRELVSNLKPALRNHPDAPPGNVGNFEHLVQQCLGFFIPLFTSLHGRFSHNVTRIRLCFVCFLCHFTTFER